MPFARALSVALVFTFAANTNAASGVVPGYRIEMPRDAGSHSDFQTEWWYLTGWLQDERGVERGFQITFFRSRNERADLNPSKFAPKQILFAHAALSDPALGKLLRAERTARIGFGLVEAEEGRLNIHLDQWSLQTDENTTIARVNSNDFMLDLALTPTQPPLLHGANGYSRKSAVPNVASYYYSQPQLRVRGNLIVKKTKVTVIGKAWFDHEWSNTYVDTDTIGWDWLGINLDNGDAVMTFQMRSARNEQAWASGTWRSDAQTRSFSASEISWTPLRRWQSPRTGVDYPIAWRVKVGTRELILRPLMDDQENDARGSVGILYWEGAVEALDAMGRILGHGYLELTGYGERVEF